MVGRTELFFIVLVLVFLFYPYINFRPAKKPRRKWFWDKIKKPRFWGQKKPDTSTAVSLKQKETH